MVKLNETDYMFKELKKLYPDNTEFYSRYYSGTYYDTAYTEYYDKEKRLIYTKRTKTYG